MERVDHRANGADNRSIKNQRKESDYQFYARRKQQLDERARDNARFSMEMMMEREEYEEDNEEEEISTRQTNPEIKTESRFGLCSVCHLSVADRSCDKASYERASFSAQGHLLCRRCMENFMIQSGGNASMTCNVRVSEQMDPYADRNAEEKDARYHQQRSYCNIIRKDDRDRYASELKLNGQSTWECSRRPIRCPRVDCAVNVAFSALTHHFLFDHPEVPILSVDPGVKSTLVVSFAALSRDTSRCLALLLVSGKLSDPAARLFNSSQINPKYRNRLPLPLLAARLHSTNRYAPPDEVHAGGEGQCEGDIIIVWVAGLDIGNAAEILRCSIQAVDNIDSESFRSLAYTGPVNSLRTAQRPREVFLNGDCIVLHEGLIGHITSGCTSLNVNVIIH
ncbi:hypothetical protein KPH14_009051 [Odynerus spinipes]|uniref:DUF4729 domain-containing protein n=1 Tax=Odynerus spinipes TaxID=1348599 RepID=A0AAD9VQ59_9HYME|nr:hypothetical protein KPH14_009051 [Odynerus spinipes]